MSLMSAILRQQHAGLEAVRSISRRMHGTSASIKLLPTRVAIQPLRRSHSLRATSSKVVSTADFQKMVWGLEYIPFDTVRVPAEARLVERASLADVCRSATQSSA